MTTAQKAYLYVFLVFAIAYIGTLPFQPYPGDFVIKAIPIVSLSMQLGSWQLQHEPDLAGGNTRRFVVGGHWHPTITLGRGADRSRWSCFVVGPRRMVVPAFGLFTGGFPFPCEDEDAVFAVPPLHPPSTDVGAPSD